MPRPVVGIAQQELPRTNRLRSRPSLNSERFLKSQALSAGTSGFMGFCWGGRRANFLPVTLGTDLKAALKQPP